MRTEMIVCLALHSVLLACGPAVQQPSHQAILDSRDFGTREEGATLTEKSLLPQVGKLVANQATSVGGVSVVALAPYDAASGLRCRELLIGPPDQQVSRLACADGESWFFVPSVFESKPVN